MTTHKHIRLYFLFVCMLLSCITSFCQEDEPEGMETYQNKHDKDSAYADRERKLLEGVDYDYNIIKVNIIPLFSKGIGVQFERRMNLNFSYLTELEFVSSQQRKRQKLLGGLRYYYNLEKRILHRYEKKGEKTSCMSANYFQTDLTFGNYTGERYKTIELDGAYISSALKIGMQRRLWKYGYYDLWMEYRVLLPDPRPVKVRNFFSGNFRIGFAIGVAF